MRSCGADGKTMCGSSDEKLENLQAKSTVGGQPASKGNADIFFRNVRRVVLSMARESTPAEETSPEVADSMPGGLFHVTPDVSSPLYSLASIRYSFAFAGLRYRGTSERPPSPGTIPYGGP